ncbi:MAG: ADP-forming succinate--CoA ligase subunit beta [Candidatus Baldrarchaeia archaeon]
MKLYEYQAKNIFREYQIPVPEGQIAETPEKAVEIAKSMSKPVAVKAQVLVGGRGKAGGIRFANIPEKVAEIASQLLGSKIKGVEVRKVLVEEKLEIERELYIGITVDRSARRYVAIASSRGGVDIEEIAEKHPEEIIKHYIDPLLGFHSFEAREIVKKMGLRGKDLILAADILNKLWKIVEDYDAELVEINPLIKTRDGKIIAADARLIIDDNALFRHSEFKEVIKSEKGELNERELKASERGLAYVELEGDIGIIGNGAGLVMATLDMVSLYGGKPANFLDVGGGADPERMEAALEIVLSNPRVKVVFINILGGITRCDWMAKGIIEAREKIKTRVPLVVRMVGTLEEEGKKILEEAGIDVLDSMEEAAKRAVEISKQLVGS